ncbi:alpha/beta fold hydrolase [Demequina iriomotensis]|uniref:alpha/beta fold hydrolase n=1 Tax=Demequina iriomotensis TaxID=1536641 RepID=UPI0007831CBF|nr:alpha/beta hydrolase [Demequina iriomotensis]
MPWTATHGSRRDDARYREAEAAVWRQHGMPDPTERWSDVAGLGIRVRSMEHGEGRPVVFVHGNPTAGANLVPLVGAMEGIRAIVVDRPGCGLSDPLDYSDMTPAALMDAIARSLAAVVEQSGAGPVDLVGNSAGGMAVLVLAARRPDLVRSVVVEGVPAIRGMRLPRAVRASAIPAVARLVERHALNERDLRRSFAAMGHGGLIEAGRVSRPDLEWRYALSRCTDTYRHELALMSRAATWRGLRPEWVVGRDTLEAIEARSLWVVGDRDPFATPARVEAWARHARGSTVRIVRGTGHQPWLDDASGQARTIARWWARAEAVAR